jgi:hypothetical protein
MSTATETAYKLDRTDWSRLTTAQRIKHLEIEGYIVMPDLLPPPLVVEMRSELDRLPTKAVDYSENQRYHHDIQFTDSPRCIETIALPAIIEFLTTLFADEIICTSCGFAVSRPGHPGIALHTDSQPYGSAIFGMQASSPRLVRVLYYLDDLTPPKAPFKVIPHSHLSFHSDNNPYKRYLSHPEEVMVTCKAGSAVIINQAVWHANFPNTSTEDRHLLAIAYRPGWASPIAEVPEWPAEKVTRLPAHVRAFFRSLNTRNFDYNVKNRPDNMATAAPGINPSRWDA